jgi:hypothetical protein
MHLISTGRHGICLTEGMSKLSPSKSSPNEISPVNIVFVPTIENGKGMRVPVLELDDQIRTLDSCGHYKWMTLRDYLAANTSCPQMLKSPLERFSSAMGDIEHRKVDGKTQSYVKAKVGKADEGIQSFVVQELRVSADLLRFLKKQEASYLPPLHTQISEAYERIRTAALVNRLTNNKFQEAYNELQKIGKDRAGSRTSIFRKPTR